MGYFPNPYPDYRDDGPDDIQLQIHDAAAGSTNPDGGLKGWVKGEVIPSLGWEDCVSCVWSTPRECVRAALPLRGSGWMLGQGPAFQAAWQWQVWEVVVNRGRAVWCGEPPGGPFRGCVIKLLLRSQDGLRKIFAC